MTTTAALPELKTVAEAAMVRWDVPGLAAGVLRDGAITVIPFGLASTETAMPVREDTIFQAGSISKIFTTTLLMQLVDEGRIDLDAPIRSYLPELRLGDMEALAQISPRILLAHVGGFVGDRFPQDGYGDDALRSFVAGFGSLAQITPPGAHFSYCNTGFMIAGAIVERLRGETFESELRRRILAPLGMEHTFLLAHEAMTYPLAIGHNTLPGEARRIARQYPLARAANPAGGVLCTAGDLLRFAQAHLNDGELDGTRILSTASARLMREPQYPAGGFADHYGVGWALRTVDGIRIAGHGGSTNGFRAQLTLVPDRGIAVALLTNGSQGRAVNATVERALLESVAGLHPDEPVRIALSEAQLTRFAGRYERPLNRVDVQARDGGIVFEHESESALSGLRSRAAPVRAEAIGPAQFVIVAGENEGERVEFIEDDGGRVRFMRIHGRLTDRV